MSHVHNTIGEYLAEHDPVQALWHHLEEVVGATEDPDDLANGLTRLTLPASNLFLVGLFEGEVVHGGFRQFLVDPSGDLTEPTIQALKEVGAHVSSELLTRAIAPFRGPVPTDRSDRLDLLASLEEEDPDLFTAFDDLYNQHVDHESPQRVERIDSLLLDYMKEHAAVWLRS